MPAGLRGRLRRALADVEGKTNARLRFVGYTRNERLERRTALIYGDDVGLSAARARRAMEAIAAELQLAPSQAEFEGRGYVQSDDVVNAGFIQGETSRVVVQVVYDEVAQLDDYDGVEITPLTRELEPENAFGSEPDAHHRRRPAARRPGPQLGRRAALHRRRAARRRHPVRLRQPRGATAARGRGAIRRTVAFYANSDGWAADAGAFPHVRELLALHRPRRGADLRRRSSRSRPSRSRSSCSGPPARGEWQPEPEPFAAPARELKYVLRAYGAGGTFDETVPQPLWISYRDVGRRGRALQPTEHNDESQHGPRALVLAEFATAGAPTSSCRKPRRSEPTVETVRRGPDRGGSRAARGLRREQRSASATSRSRSGTVTVRGSAIPPDHRSGSRATPCPSTRDGNFVAEEILPAGVHTVEVAVLDDEGNGELYLRDLEFKQNDWFYVGMADVTLSQNEHERPDRAAAGRERAVRLRLRRSTARLAFYVNGKFGERLAADGERRHARSADRRSVQQLPRQVARLAVPAHRSRLSLPDVRRRRHRRGNGADARQVLREGQRTARTTALWGNFKVGYMDNELAQVDRGLYGANAALRVRGRRRASASGASRVDGFAAEPGTIASCEEFRGTGGSLYFLQRQDILTGSERVRIELRDQASGLVTGVVNLRPAHRLRHRLPARPRAARRAAVVDARRRSAGAQRRHAAATRRISSCATSTRRASTSSTRCRAGGQGHYWFNDHVQARPHRERRTTKATPTAASTPRT